MSVSFIALAALLLSACASVPDAAETRDALVEVTAEPAAPDAAAEFSVEHQPDPLVEAIDCTPYLVITARGTGEPTKGQLLSPVARLISEARPGQVQVLDLDYPAGGEVKESATVGVRMLIDTLNVQADACDEQRFVLLGYSQGSLVVGDALVDAGLRMVGETVGAVTQEAADRILAVVLYGDPRFVGSEDYNVGDFDAEVNGLLARTAGELAAYRDRIRDYCGARDFICQISLDLDESGHVVYFKNGMQQDGAAFVITLLDPVDLRDDTLADETEDAP